MRHHAAVVCLAALAGPAAALAGESDDPKARGEAGTPTVSAQPEEEHANPRLKVSYRGFGITGLDGGNVALKGGQIDFYPVSRRFFRLGLEGELGVGDTTMSGGTANLWYGVGGVSAGFQYPARVTPFIEGRFAAGALGGKWSGVVGTVNGQPVTVNDASATTFMYVGGVEAGVELYTVGRLYLSASIGWAHPVYTGVDYAAMQQNPSGGMQLRQISADTFTFKLGVGI